ncbi:hypothetical protein M758_UG258900 [Ceratodon purpureus]|nr:hypothetical protein M758_UG258900 [Ceratodon purpureus]
MPVEYRQPFKQCSTPRSQCPLEMHHRDYGALTPHRQQRDKTIATTNTVGTLTHQFIGHPTPSQRRRHNDPEREQIVFVPWFRQQEMEKSGRLPIPSCKICAVNDRKPQGVMKPIQEPISMMTIGSPTPLYPTDLHPTIRAARSNTRSGPPRPPLNLHIEPHSQHGPLGLVDRLQGTHDTIADCISPQVIRTEEPASPDTLFQTRPRQTDESSNLPGRLNTNTLVNGHKPATTLPTALTKQAKYTS